MSLLFRSRPAEQRAITWESLPFDRGGSTLGAGMSAALRLVPLYSAVGMITDSISTTPWKAYRNSGETGKVPLPRQPGLLTDPGLFGLDRTAWLSQAISSLLLRGNAYGQIASTDAQNTPTKIAWIHPDRVQVDESGPRPIYRIGGQEVADLLHIAGLVLPGSVVGMSPIGLFRRQLETGMRVGDLTHAWYADGTSPSGILHNKSRPLAAGEAATAKERFKSAMADRDVLVTGSDWGYEPMTPTPADAQFIEATQASANQIAAIYRVPPEDIGGVASSSMTYATLEMNQIRYTQRAILPWSSRVENAISAQFPRPVYVKFNLDALARTDLKTRMDAHAVALDNGIRTLDEVRELEDLPPLTPEQLADWQTNFAGTRPQTVITKGMP